MLILSKIVGCWFVAQFWATVVVLTLAVAAVVRSHLRRPGRG